VKKNKKEIVKRQAKAKEKAKKKRQIHLVKIAPKPQIMERTPISQMEAPQGFMAVSSSQALMQYAQPLMEEETASLDELNRRMEVVSSLWNVAVSRQKNDPQRYARAMEKAKATVKKVLSLDGEERTLYIEKMIERQVNLFPEEVQPEPPSMFMYMRKDVSHLIAPFDYNRIGFTVDAAIPPDEEDLDLIQRIDTLDEHIRRGTDYGEYEKLAISVEDDSIKLFGKWLIAKGFRDDPEEFAHCPEIYITFLYRYLHDDPLLLKSVPVPYVVEFFEDYLLRKMICEPHEYLYWPPSLKLFYRFLHEKGYLSSKEMNLMLGALDTMETHFLEILQARYH